MALAKQAETLLVVKSASEEETVKKVWPEKRVRQASLVAPVRLVASVFPLVALSLQEALAQLVRMHSTVAMVPQEPPVTRVAWAPTAVTAPWEL